MCVYRAVIVCVRVGCVCARGQEVRFGVSALWPESLFGHEVSFQPLNLLVECLVEGQKQTKVNKCCVEARRTRVTEAKSTSKFSVLLVDFQLCSCPDPCCSCFSYHGAATA